MKFKAVTVLDHVANVFSQPHFVQSLGVAHRSFTDVVNGRAGESPLALHPEDYSLYELGEFDDQAGALVPLETPRLLAKGLDVKVQP